MANVSRSPTASNSSYSAASEVRVDRITKSMLSEFEKAQSLEGMRESDAFERFANYALVTRELGDTFNIEDVSTGGGGDAGIDGLAVIVNNVLVTTVEEIEDAAAHNRFLEVTFLFVQAKTTSGFNGGEIGTFTFGVKDFFSENPLMKHNEFVERARALQAAVFDRGNLFTRGKPKCRLFYVTTGKWQSDPALTARLRTGESDLDGLGLFSRVEVEALGADEVQALYQRTKNRSSVEFTFPHRAVLPEIEGVSEAHIGVLPASEFLRLIVDETGSLRRNLFYDNVRDFQGSGNEVNAEISATLESASDRGRFPVLNNGVTIVAKSLRNTAHKFLMEDYQIVNGCQTSHLIYAARDKIDEKVHVPVKIIVTIDDSITTAIIKATNSQTAVRREQLEALSEFQKKLEAYFSTFEGKRRIYYERRSGQYSGNADVEKVRVITMIQLIRAFASVFMNEPHRVTRSYASVLGGLGTSIFAPKHQLKPYYASAFAHYKLEFFFRNQQLDPGYKPARYHMLMAIGLLAAGVERPLVTANKVDKYCDKILEVLWDDKRALQMFQEAGGMIKDVATGTLDGDEVRTQPFTAQLLQRLGAT